MPENCKRFWFNTGKLNVDLIKETVIEIKFLSLRVLYTSGKEVCKRP